MSIVLFVGAGFSAPFGQPTMNQFMTYALENLDQNDQQFLLELALDARRANSMLESSPTNLEDILSFAVMGDRLGLFGEHGKPRAPQLKHILQSIYSNVRSDDLGDYWNRYGVLKSFLGFKERHEYQELSVITTNYDLNIESALRWLDASAELPFEYRENNPGGVHWRASLYNRRGNSRHRGVPLFKLHGSVNWFEDEDDSVECVAAIVDVRHGRELPYACAGDFEYEETPIIIPPSFLKPDMSGAMVKVWQGAAKALNSAESVIFIGYSFPPTDVEMKYFLARSLSDNARLRRIIIVDENADGIVERLKDDSSGFGSHFKSLLTPLNGDWTRRTNILDV